jgi:hypothetical protein
MRDRCVKRIEEGLEKLEKRLAQSKKIVNRNAIERQIGRLLGSNERAGGRYRIQVIEESARPSGLKLVKSLQFDWNDWAQESEGCYVLRTNASALTKTDPLLLAKTDPPARSGSAFAARLSRWREDAAG